jgi:hypothetical protein
MIVPIYKVKEGVTVTKPYTIRQSRRDYQFLMALIAKKAAALCIVLIVIV